MIGASDVSLGQTDGRAPAAEPVAAAGRARTRGTEQAEQRIAGLKSRLTGPLESMRWRTPG